jgi:hypothetical protein
MRIITRHEIESCREAVDGMSETETRALMERMSQEQPFLQVYIAAILERGDFTSEADMDAFASLSATVWHAMRTAAGEPLAQVGTEEIDQREAKAIEFLEYAGGESEEGWRRLVETWREGANQLAMVTFIVEMLMSPDSPYDVTPDGSGLILVYLKVIMDCLDNAPQQKQKT